MVKVVIMSPKDGYDKFQIPLPKDWDVTFVDYTASEAVKKEAFASAEYAILSSFQGLSGEIIRSCPRLKLIQMDGAGFNGIDLPATQEMGIPVCNNRTANIPSVSEHHVGLILAGLRRTAVLDRELKKGNYAACLKEYRAVGARDLSQLKVGLVGIGAIGKEVARRLEGFGCRKYYYDVFRPAPETEKALNVEYMEFDELLSTCDVISICVPLLPSTYNMIGEEQLEKIKTGALLINTARGEVVNTPALCRALERGVYACVDTVDVEPMPADHPFLQMSEAARDRLILTPHVAGVTDDSLQRMMLGAVENVDRMVRGEPIVNIVNGK